MREARIEVEIALIMKQEGRKFNENLQT